MSAAAKAVAGGVRLDVEVKVRASRTRVLGLKSERLSVSLAAPPVDGAANDLLCRTLAEFFGVSRRDVEIASGHHHRRKVVEIRGLGLAGALARIDALQSA